MAQIWLRLKREDIYRTGRLHGPWLYLQQRDAVYANSGLRTIIDEGFPLERLEEAVIPIEVVATSLTDGGERWFTYGPAVDAILASAAMPAIFPPVEIDGEQYIDGGVVDNVPIQRAIDAGATRIVVLLCSPPVVDPDAVPAAGRGHGQRPAHRHPRPVRPGHGPPARGRRGHPVRRPRGDHPGLRRLLDHRAPDRPGPGRGLRDRPSLRPRDHPLPGPTPAGPGHGRRRDRRCDGRSRSRPSAPPGGADASVRRSATTRRTGRATGQSGEPVSSGTAAAEPVTQPDPGT